MSQLCSGELLDLLKLRGINFSHFCHSPVATTKDAAKLLTDLPGRGSKNLFLRDKSGNRHFLVSVLDEKKVDLKALNATLNCDRLSFASEERLFRFLGVAPGSVTLFGLINDLDRKVEVYIDKDLWESPLIHCHPLVNSETVVIEPKELEKFFVAIGIKYRTIEIPGTCCEITT